MHPSILLAFAGIASAHFRLNYPAAILPGDDDDGEGTGPCGGSTLNVTSSSTKVNVNQFAVSIMNGHPTGDFSFFASTSTSEPYNFTKLTSNIESSGVGSFCATGMSAPSSFAGKAGVLQVVDNSVDGQLYLCAAVNFVSSGGDAPSKDTCANSSSTTITWSSSNAVTNGTSTTSGAASATAATTTSSKAAAAAATMVSGLLAGVGMVAAGLLV